MQVDVDLTLNDMFRPGGRQHWYITMTDLSLVVHIQTKHLRLRHLLCRPFDTGNNNSRPRSYHVFIHITDQPMASTNFFSTHFVSHGQVTYLGTKVRQGTPTQAASLV